MARGHSRWIRRRRPAGRRHPRRRLRRARDTGHVERPGWDALRGGGRVGPRARDPRALRRCHRQTRRGRHLGVARRGVEAREGEAPTRGAQSRADDLGAAPRRDAGHRRLREVPALLRPRALPRRGLGGVAAPRLQRRRARRCVRGLRRRDGAGDPGLLDERAPRPRAVAPRRSPPLGARGAGGVSDGGERPRGALSDAVIPLRAGPRDARSWAWGTTTRCGR